jgi:hypothetical protein
MAMRDCGVVVSMMYDMVGCDFLILALCMVDYSWTVDDLFY